VTRFGALLKDAEALDQFAAMSASALPLYREAQAATSVYELRAMLAATQPTSYLEPASKVDPQPIAGARAWLPATMPDDVGATWDWGAAAAERVTRLMLRAVSQAPATYNDLREALHTRVGRIQAARRALDARLRETAPGTGPISEAQAAAAIDAAYAALSLSEALAAQVRGAATDFATTWLAKPQRSGEVLRAALCVEVADGVGATPASPAAGPLFDFMRVGIGRTPNLLARAFAEAELAEAAEGAGVVNANDILYGTRLSHFAAFGRPEWRAWDWMWGRLHAVTYLGEILQMSPPDVDAVAAAVISAEGRTVEDVEAQIPEVLGLSATALLDELRDQQVLAPALDAIFELLSSAAATAPPVPRPVAGGGRWAADLFSRHPKPMAFGRKCARWGVASLGFYRKLWRQTRR
jgi:hypothetical protein